MSKLINEKIRLAYSIQDRGSKSKDVKKVRVKLGKRLGTEDIERFIEG